MFASGGGAVVVKVKPTNYGDDLDSYFQSFAVKNNHYYSEVVLTPVNAMRISSAPFFIVHWLNAVKVT